jgi:hypothetical protein
MTYVQYDKKEHNTTVGMPALAAVDPFVEKESEENFIPLTPDMYAFIVVCPPMNISFLISLYVILLKYVLYGFLFSGINITQSDSIFNSTPIVQLVKAFLTPVAVSMQDDLIQAYANSANLKYDERVLRISRDATKQKLIFASLLRWLDGFLSLGVNFYVMLATDDTLGVFLNFAALHFLQGIDDVFYELVTKGFLGDEMENMTDVCGKIKFRKRTNNNCVKDLDTILYVLTLLICAAIYGYVTWQTNIGTWQEQ